MIYIFIVFILTYYLGLTGFSKPSTLLSIISSISFILLIINLIIKFSFNYILPFILILILFIWSKSLLHLPMYGEFVIYNPFSSLGIGQKFYGQKIEPLKKIIQML